MKKNNFYLVAGAVIVVSLATSVTVFAINRKRRRDELDEYILFIKGHQGDSRSLNANKGFSPDYYKSTMQTRLTHDAVKQIADDIWGAYNNRIFNDKSQLFSALRRPVNLSQVSQVSEYFYNKYNTYLLSFLQEKVSMNDVYDILKNLK